MEFIEEEEDDMLIEMALQAELVEQRSSDGGEGGGDCRKK